jgi:hypothetical protein
LDWCSVSYWDSYCFGFSAILVLLRINAWEGEDDFGIVFLDLLLEWVAWVLLLGYLADQTSIEYVYKISSIYL